MKKTEFEKREYITPECKIYPIKDEQLLQSTSIELNVPHTKEEDWEENEDIDAGEIEI